MWVIVIYREKGADFDNKKLHIIDMELKGGSLGGKKFGKYALLNKLQYVCLEF
jgi:hypothetical protein